MPFGTQSERTPELQAVLDALLQRKAAWHLKARLLRGVSTELRAARESGLTWKVIWNTLAEAGYPGSYAKFCKLANQILDPDPVSPPSRSTAPAIGSQAQPQSSIQPTVDRPGAILSWQAAAQARTQQLELEAQRIRQQELERKQEIVFTMDPFKGRMED